MTYPGLDTLNATNDLTQILVYMNTLTGGVFAPSILVGFFLIIMIGSMFYQYRFQGRYKMEVSFTVAGFCTFGLGVLMSSTNGLLDPSYLFVTLAISILGVMWIYFSQE